MEMNEKVVSTDHHHVVNDEKMVAKNEPNYRGIKAMPFVIGNMHYSYSVLVLGFCVSSDILI